MRAGTPADVVCTSEAAAILKRTPDNVRWLVRTGKLVPVISTGAGKLFAREDVERLSRRKSDGRRYIPEPAPVA